MRLARLLWYWLNLRLLYTNGLAVSVSLLQLIETGLSRHNPGKKLLRPLMKRSAVAMILQLRAGELHILMIKRADREGDPWSAQMAFPGGHLDPVDQNLKAAAMRETMEEIDVSLAGAHYLGPVDQQG